MGLLDRLFKGMFDFPRHESQGPTDEELKKAEAEGYKWDDRIGFYRDSYEGSPEHSVKKLTNDQQD